MVENSPLRKLRIARGLTQQQLADLVGVDQGALSRIERGEQVPSPERAARIADRLGREWITELHILYPERYAERAA